MIEKRMILPGPIRERGSGFGGASALASLADFCRGALRGLAEGPVALESDVLGFGVAWRCDADALPGVKPVKLEDVRDAKCDA